MEESSMNLLYKAFLKIFPQKSKPSSPTQREQNAPAIAYDGYSPAANQIDIEDFCTNGGIAFGVIRAFVQIDGKRVPVVTVQSLIESCANTSAYFENKMLSEGERQSYKTAVEIYSYMRDFFISVSTKP
jgi:hypothetical protein